MKCKDLELLLSEAQSGDTLPREAHAHLSSCRACRQFQEEMDKVWVWMDAWKGIEPSAGFQDRFWAKARSPKSLPVRPLRDWFHLELFFPLWRPVSVGVIALALLVGGSLLLRFHPSWQPDISTLSLQKDEDNLLLQNLRESDAVEATEELEAFDAWILVNDEIPSAAPVDEPYNSPDSPERRTWIMEPIDLA